MKTKSPTLRAVNWRIEEEVRDALKVVAIKRKTTCEELVNEQLKQWLSRNKQFPLERTNSTS